MSLYLSASAIKDYIECPQKFWYRLSKAKEAEQTLPMRLGNIIHKLLEHSDEWDTLQEGLILASAMLDSFGLEGYDVNNLLPYLKIFNDYWRNLLSSEDLIEHNFKFPIANDVYLVGKFDRILKKSNTVLDWKTGKETPSSLKNSIQFIIYDEAYRILYGKRPESTVYASLVKPILIPYQRSEARVSVVFDEIIPKIVHDWKYKNYARFGMFANKCHMCAFKNICYDELEYDKDELGG